MKPQRNKFEMAAHDIQYRKPRPSWEHNIETYQGNGTSIDWFLVGGVSILLVFGAGALVALV